MLDLGCYQCSRGPTQQELIANHKIMYLPVVPVPSFLLLALGRCKSRRSATDVDLFDHPNRFPGPIAALAEVVLVAAAAALLLLLLLLVVLFFDTATAGGGMRFTDRGFVTPGVCCCFCWRGVTALSFGRNGVLVVASSVSISTVQVAVVEVLEVPIGGEHPTSLVLVPVGPESGLVADVAIAAVDLLLLLLLPLTWQAASSTKLLKERLVTHIN